MDKMSAYSRKYCPPELKNIEDVTERSHRSRAYDILYKIAADLAPTNTWAEFGVGSALNTTKVLRDVLAANGNLFLFDSWEGIPDPWALSDTFIEPTGSWKFPSSVGARLQRVDNRLVMTDGWFKDTLPFSFPEQLGLINIDCDVYSSTRDVLFGVNEFINCGTVIIFDELIGYKNYRDHEYRAMCEWMEETGRRLEWRAKERFAAVGIVT
jgi:hypothetical protein